MLSVIFGIAVQIMAAPLVALPTALPAALPTALITALITALPTVLPTALPLTIISFRGGLADNLLCIRIKIIQLSKK